MCFSQNGPEVGGQFQGRRDQGAESGQERCTQWRFLWRSGEEVSAQRLRHGGSRGAGFHWLRWCWMSRETKEESNKTPTGVRQDLDPAGLGVRKRRDRRVVKLQRSREKVCFVVCFSRNSVGRRSSSSSWVGIRLVMGTEQEMLRAHARYVQKRGDINPRGILSLYSACRSPKDE